MAHEFLVMLVWSSQQHYIHAPTQNLPVVPLRVSGATSKRSDMRFKVLPARMLPISAAYLDNKHAANRLELCCSLRPELCTVLANKIAPNPETMDEATSHCAETSLHPSAWSKALLGLLTSP
eukprot:6466369-Amphidinium_carterae.1